MSDDTAPDSNDAVEAAASDGWLGWILMRHAAAQWTGGAVIFVAFTVGVWTLWQTVGPRILAEEPFRLTPDKITIATPAPDWVTADIRAEVVRDGSLDRIDLFDPQATVQVAQAFALHPWVEQAVKVTKQHPAGVTVRLKYRRPVAMVEVVVGNERGLLPVDWRGVLLPPEDFTPEAARDYPRIAAGGVPPSVAAGSAWGDRRIEGAARLAALLAPRWPALGLYRIAAYAGDSAADPPLLELHTRDATVVVWGNPPGEERPGEATAEDKVVKLAEYVQQHGPLGGGIEPLRIDLRGPRDVRLTPRTATRPRPQ